MICRKCGARLVEDSLFCDQCGQRVDTPPPASATPSILPAASWSPPPPTGATARIPTYTPPPAQPSAPARRGGRLAFTALLALALVAAGAFAVNGGLIPILRQPTATALAAVATVATPTLALPSPTVAATRASGTATLVAVAATTGTPTTAARPTSAPTVAKSPTRASAATQPPVAKATPTVSWPTVVPAVPGVARAIGKTGITVEGPRGWTYVEDLDSPQEGTVRFYAQKSETTRGFFSSSGVFAISTWLAPEATEYSPEDLLLGFIDGQVTEYASRFGGSPTVGNHTIQSVGNSRVAGWSTTFTISGKGGTFTYGWADLRTSGRFVQVICQSAPERWDDVSAKCEDAADTIDLGD